MSLGAQKDIRNPIPATFLRGGTSKGIFINRSDLPKDQSKWDRIFLGLMGSPDPIHGRQLNGMGGGISSLSKVCVVGSPSSSQREQGIHTEYTFVQVGIRDSSIDYSGNCGNLSSMIGVFAVDEGICDTPSPGTRATIRSFNTNTQKIIDTTFPISDSDTPFPVLELPQTEMAGVPGKASKIILDFVEPSGARTGKLLPSGSSIDNLDIPATAGTPPFTILASLVDATNPTVFVRSSDLNLLAPFNDYIKGQQAAIDQVSPLLEAIRQKGAKRMGLDPSAQGQPKIAILSSPPPTDDERVGTDIIIHALSMGVLHKAVPMTVGLCLGVAARTKGTIAWDIVKHTRSSKAHLGNPELLTIQHPGGTVEVGAEFDEAGKVRSAKVLRTGRRLMKGVVWW